MMDPHKDPHVEITCLTFCIFRSHLFKTMPKALDCSALQEKSLSANARWKMSLGLNTGNGELYLSVKVEKWLS